MPMGMQNVLLLMGGDFQFYCLQLKIPVGMSNQHQHFPTGDTLSIVNLSMGMKFQCIYLTGDDFWPIFQVGRGSHRIFNTGMSYFCCCRSFRSCPYNFAKKLIPY